MLRVLAVAAGSLLLAWPVAGQAQNAGWQYQPPKQQFLAERPYRTVPDTPPKKQARKPVNTGGNKPIPNKGADTKTRRAVSTAQNKPAPPKKAATSTLTKPKMPATKDPAKAPAKNPAKKQAGGWSLICSSFSAAKANPCRVFLGVYLRKTRQLLLGVSVRPVGKEGAPAMLFRTPFGTFLPAGVRFQVDDGKETKLAYQTCNAKGCFTSTAISKALLVQMQGGKRLTVIIQNLKRQDIKIGLALNGFSGAYRKMMAK